MDPTTDGSIYRELMPQEDITSLGGGRREMGSNDGSCGELPARVDMGSKDVSRGPQGRLPVAKAQEGSDVGT